MKCYTISGGIQQALAMVWSRKSNHCWLNQLSTNIKGISALWLC